MTSTDYLGYAFGAVVYGSGLAGFVLKKNKFSLGLGSVFGGLAFLGAYEASKNPDEPLIAAASAGGFAGFMIGKHLLEFRKGSVSFSQF